MAAYWVDMTVELMVGNLVAMLVDEMVASWVVKLAVLLAEWLVEHWAGQKVDWSVDQLGT